MIYICYSIEDKPIAIKICNFLEAKIPFKFIANEQQLAGVDYAKELIGKIESSEAILFFYSKNAENSTWIMRELEFARSKKKLIIPVFLSKPLANSWYNVFFKGVEIIYFDRNGLEEIGKGIIKALGQIEKEERIVYPEIRRPSKERRKVSYARRDCRERPSEGEFEECFHSPRMNLGCGCTIVICVLLILFYFFNRYGSTHPNASSIDSICIEDSSYVEDSLRIEVPDTISSEPSSEESDTILPERNIESGRGFEWYSKYEYLGTPFQSWLLVLLSFSAGCGIMFILLRIKRSRKVNVKLSSDIASIISIDGDKQKEIESREVYSTHLDKGDYLIDFVDKRNKERHQTFNHTVNSNDSKLIFANFEGTAQDGGKIIKCFIAGSKSLQRERDALRAVTCVMYNKWATKNFRILSFTFEDFERAAVSGGHQRQYNAFIEKEADWALFIIDGQIGGITIEEYRIAMESYMKNGRPKILVFAKEGSEDNEEVAAIKAEINNQHQYWTDYTDISGLKLLFESTLNWDLINIYQK